MTDPTERDYALARTVFDALSGHLPLGSDGRPLDFREVDDVLAAAVKAGRTWCVGEMRKMQAYEAKSPFDCETLLGMLANTLEAGEEP